MRSRSAATRETRRCSRRSASVLDWLESLGVFWSEPFIAYSGKQAKSYAMPGNSAGRSYVLALMAHLRRFGCRLALSTPVTGFRP